MKYKAAVAALLILVFAGFASAAGTSVKADPVNKTVLVSNASVNGSNVSTNTLPFPVDTSNDSITADIPVSLPAGNVSGKVVLENNFSRSFVVDIQPYVDWKFTPETINETLNVGTSGKLSNQTISLQGNTETTVDIELTGNASRFFDAPSQVTVYPGINSSVVLQYNIRETTSYGEYNGTLHLNDSYNNSQKVPLHFQFRDNVTPAIQNVDTPSFTATFPENFTVKASDNLNITTVQADILKEAAVEDGNTTETVNTTVETLSFKHIPNTEKWTARPPADVTGHFYVDGYVKDGAGNRKNFSTSFTVYKLDAVQVNDSVEFQNYRVESEILEKIGEVEKKTSVEATLESFSQPLQSPNETWNLALKTDNGEKFLRRENDSVTLQGPTPVYLKLYGDSAERFNGRISFEGVRQHVPINDLRFNGQYLNCKIPEKEVITIFDRNVTYTPVNSDSCEKAGWTVSYNISADTVPIGSNLKEATRVFIPKQLQQEAEEFRTEEKQRLKRVIGATAFQRTLAIFVAVLGWAAFLWERRVSPSFYYTRLKSTDTFGTSLFGDDDEDGFLG